MPSQCSPRGMPALGKAVATSLVPAVCLTLAWSAHAALESGIYETAPGATVLERGEHVPNGSRIVPRSATLTFDLATAQPSLTVVIHDAVLEGGRSYADLWLGERSQPFELTVRSLSGSQLVDGSYKFSGDYLRDIYPSGTQYLFDWQFSTTSGGNIVWSGNTYWAGGHLWGETISGITLVPEPGTLALIGVGAGMLWARRRSQKS